MVSLALIIFIMSILSAAFGAASKTVRDLRAAGDLAEKLRGVGTMMRYDLAAQHFDRGRLSDGSVWGTTTYAPPNQGFFRIRQSRMVDPLTEKYGIAIPEWTNTVSSLHFTVKWTASTPADVFTTDLGLTHPIISAALTPGDREQRFQSSLPGNTVFKSEWGEVIYWLEPTGETTDPESSNPQPLYNLCRRQRLLWPYGGSGLDCPPGTELSTRQRPFSSTQRSSSRMPPQPLM